MSGIASSAGDLAGTMAGAKTASDIQTVSKFDSADDFIESEVKKDRDVTSGQALVNVDSSENTKRGRSESVGLTGYVSQMFGENAGSAILATVTGVGTAEGMVRKFGPEWNNGIVKPTFNKLADALGFEKSTPQSSSNNSFEQSPKKSGNSNNSKSNYSPENKSKNSVHHKKNPSFLKINDYNKNGKNVQAETADSAKKGTGFFEGISKRVSNAFSVLGDNKLTTTGLSLAAASLFVPTDSDASTVKAPKPDEIKAASGDIKVSSGETNGISDALSHLGAGDMDSTKAVLVGNQRFNIDRDVTSGQALVNVDSSENTKRGRSESVGLTGYVSQMFGENAGAAILATVTGVGTAEGMVRKFGPEGNNGIVKPAFKSLANGGASLFGMDKPFPKAPDNTVSKSSNSNQGKPNYSPDNKSKNSVHHKKNSSFLKINDYNENGKNAQAETADSAKKGTGFFEGISKRVSNAFSVLSDNKLTTTGLSLAAASLFVPTDSDASTVKAPKPDEIKAASGDIKVSSGETNGISDALSHLGAGDMDSTKAVLVGNQRFNIDRDVTSGQALVNVDSSENTKRGRSESVGLTGYVSQMFGENAGAAILATVTGVGTAEGIARKFGAKDGLIVPGYNKVKSVLSGKDAETDQQSMNSSNNKYNSKPNYSPNNKSKNSVHHKKNPSFLKINDYNENSKNVQAETADSAKKGTGFFEGISKRVSNAFSVLGDNKLTTTGHNTSEAMKAGLVKTEDIKPVHTEAKSAQPIMAEILTVVILPA